MTLFRISFKPWKPQKILQFILAWVVFFPIFIWIVFFPFCLALRWFNPPFSSLMVYKMVFYSHPVKPSMPVRLETLPGAAKKMLVRIEDPRFFQHNGLDFQSIKEAYQVNRRLGYAYRGASTLPQQLARTLFLIPKKWYFRKALEALIALEMNLLVPKERIIELYLNSAEWGKGIFGIGAASWHYYQRPASKLSKDQLARLITILASPIRYQPKNFHKRKALLERYTYLSKF